MELRLGSAFPLGWGRCRGQDSFLENSVTLLRMMLKNRVVGLLRGGSGAGSVISHVLHISAKSGLLVSSGAGTASRGFELYLHLPPGSDGCRTTLAHGCYRTQNSTHGCSVASLLGTRISICKVSGETSVYRAEWINSLYQYHTEGKSHPAPQSD